MDPFALWDQIVVQGLFVRALEFLYTQLNDLGAPSWGLAIIVFTCVVKTLTLPLTLMSLRSSKRMTALQPKLQALQKQHKNDREKLAQEQMALYKEQGVNPVAGCLPMLVQMPIWIALYSALYSLAHNNPEFARPFLWIADLGQPEFQFEHFPAQLPILAVLTGLTQWVTTRMAMQASTDPQQQTMNQMMQYMPLMFIVFSFNVPAGLVLYWVTSNVYQMVLQYFVSGPGGLFGRPALAGAGAATVVGARPAASGSRGSESAAPSLSVSTAASGGADERPRAERTLSNSGRRRRNKRR